MKLYLFVFLLFSLHFAQTVKSQTFAPNNTQWVQERNTWINPPPQLVKTYFQFILKNDTIINNKKYSRLYSSYYSNILDSSLNCFSFWNYLNYDSNKVYLGNSPDSMRLTYDFNLVKGDSFVFQTKYCLPQPFYKCAVDSVDSIIVGNKLRKRIFFKTFYNNVQPHITWVEGIGDMRYGWQTDYGCLAYLIDFGNSTFYFDCLTDGSQVIFGTCSYGNCTTGIEEKNHNKDLLIYPNPFSSVTTLQTDNLLHNATLTVYNCFGQTVKQIKNISGKTVTFNRDNLASGLYFIRLTEENKIITVDKLVITDK